MTEQDIDWKARAEQAEKLVAQLLSEHNRIMAEVQRFGLQLQNYAVNNGFQIVNKPAAEAAK